MSTKIYNGFRVRNAKSLDEAFDALNTPANRKAVKNIVETMTRKYLAHRVSRMIDKAVLEPDNVEAADEARSPVMTALTEMWKEQREAKAEQRNCLTDYDLECSLVPVGTGEDRQILGLLFTSQKETTEWFMGLDAVEALPYWNNSDHPEELTEDEWDERGKLWDRALGNDTPADRGVTLQLHPSMPSMPTERNKLRKHMLGVPERARAWAVDHLTSMQMKKLLAPITDEKERQNRFFSVYSEAGKFIKSAEGQALVASLAAEYETRLPDLNVLDF